MIVGGMVWALFAGVAERSIFLPESLAFFAFALSWLTKGYARRSIGQTVRSVVS